MKKQKAQKEEKMNDILAQYEEKERKIEEEKRKKIEKAKMSLQSKNRIIAERKQRADQNLREKLQTYREKEESAF